MYSVVPADVVLAEEVTVLLMMLLPNTAVTLTVQLLLGAIEVMVCSVNDPLTLSVSCTDDEPHMS